MLASLQANSRPQLLFLFALFSVLTHALGQIQAINAAGTSGSSSETTSSSQPLWSYQVKPSSYVNAPALGVGQAGHYGSAPPSIFDTFNGLSQRQGALTSSPFLSILPIILIAAGGMLLLLPMLTMMMASPFGGGAGFGGFNNGAFGYPQLGALSKKRSLDQVAGQVRAGSLIDILDNVSTTIEELSRKYSAGAYSKQPTAAGSPKRAKSLIAEMDLSASNHKAATGSPNNIAMDDSTSGNGNNISNGQASSAATS